MIRIRWSRIQVEQIMLRADTISCAPKKYQKRVREIARFAADMAQGWLKENGDDIQADHVREAAGAERAR